MKLKQRLLITLTACLVLASANSNAARQGVSFYYGLGLGIIAPTDFDVTGSGEVMFGVEEDGWAIEAIGYGSLEAATDVSTTDYSVSGYQFGLAYRTVERNGNWFKYKVSSTEMNFDLTDSTTDDISSGISYTFGWGMRMGREERLEIDYSFYKSDDITDPVHMATVRYFWGGSEYLGKAF